MALFNWDASYCVGIDKVDKQHEHLVGIVNRLDEAVAAGRDEASVKDILKEALQYTQYHFKTEEGRLRDWRTPRCSRVTRPSTRNS